MEGGRAKLFLLEREAETFGRCCGVRLKSHVALSPLFAYSLHFLYPNHDTSVIANSKAKSMVGQLLP